MSEEVLVVLPEIKYAITEESAKALAKKFEKVPEFDKTLGIKDPINAQIKKDSILLNREFSNIEKLRVKIKAPALEYGKQVDALAKELKGIIEHAKLQFSEARKQIEGYEQEQEQKRINEEQERQRVIQESINALRMIPSNFIGESSEKLEAVYDGIAIPEEVDFMERTVEAIAVYKDTMTKLETMIEQAKASEGAEKAIAEAKKLQDEKDAEKAEADRLEREAFEKEKRAFEEEKRKAIQVEEARAEAERLRQVEAEAEAFEKQQAEEARKQEMLKKENIEKVKQKAKKCLVAAISVNYNGDIESIATDVLDSIIAGNITGVRWEMS